MSQTIVNPNVVNLAPLVKAICELRSFPFPYQLILAQIDQESGGQETVETIGTTPCAQNNGTGYSQIEAYYNWQALGFSTCMDCHNALLNGPYNIDKQVIMMSNLYAKYGDYPTALTAWITGQPNPSSPYSEAVMKKYLLAYVNV